MTNEPENLILKLLREMRAESTSQFEELRGAVGVVAQGLNSVRSELKEIKSDIVTVKDRLGEIALVVDHHTTRLDSIEHHLGLDAPKH
jgi:chromosome segregation ATPase